MYLQYILYHKYCFCSGVYLDGRCVQHQKPMLEGGTQGSRGHTLVVVPHLTESYGRDTSHSNDAIPLCTLKNFPHRIEHTLQVSHVTPISCLVQSSTWHSARVIISFAAAVVIFTLSTYGPLSTLALICKCGKLLSK